MSHKIIVGEKSFVIEIDPEENMWKLNEAMNAVQDAQVDYIRSLAVELRVAEQTAMDIWYLRSRSRWTKELEQKLIDADHAGNPINSIMVCNGEWQG